VFATNEDGATKMVTKILFINWWQFGQGLSFP
jgi:hypothetical protein